MTRELDFDERVVMTALRMLAEGRYIEIWPYCEGMEDPNALRDRAQQLVREHDERNEQ